MELKYPEWQSRLESMTFKQLYLLQEITKLGQSIGMEQVRPDPWFPDAELSYISSIRKRRATKHQAIRVGIWRQMQHIFQPVHDREIDPFWDDDLSHGTYRFIVLWDHWQPPQKYFLCGRRAIEPCSTPSLEKRYLWEDSSDDEV